jgi:multiple sugar transport system substrate-binding protein
MKRLIMMVLVLVAGVSLVFARGTSQQQTGTGQSASQGELTYWTYTDSANNLVNEFNKIYPDIKINLQIFGGDEYKTKLLTTIQSGQGIPDLFDLDEGYVYQFFDQGVTEDLSTRGYEEVMQDNYAYMIAAARGANGKLQAINFQTSPVGFWYVRDSTKKWLGTDDPGELAVLLGSWDKIYSAAEKVYRNSNGTVYLWPNTIEMVKVVGFSYRPFVRNGQFEITQDWYNLIDTMRRFHNSGYVAKLGSWSSEWAARWNAGELLIRVMPSWDFFTNWNINEGNIGIIKPFENAYEGGTFVSMWTGSKKKEIADVFLKFLCSDQFQRINFDSYNQVPARTSLIKTLARSYSAPRFGGQNLAKTYDEINSGVVDVVPDVYTRELQNLFQKHAEQGVQNSLDNAKIIDNFKAEARDMHPELKIN